MTDETTRPPVGTRYLIAWADGTRSGVTVAPTGKTVPADEVNVMRDGNGSGVTVNIAQLDTERPGTSFDPRSPSMRLWQALVGRGVDADEATELMNGYAHELAERQRKAIEGFDLDDHWAVYYRVSDVESLPDLIDSQTSDEEPTP